MEYFKKKVKFCDWLQNFIFKKTFANIFKIIN